LGCILYEMVSGKAPFAQNDFASVTASILRDRPAPIEPGKAPGGVIDLISRCLEKEPGMRFESAVELIHELQAIAMETSGSSPLAASAVSRSATQRRRSRGKSVAILPIVHRSDDPEDEYLMDGITESIINILSQLPRLKVTARSTAFRYKGKEFDPQEIG